ncbi:hypothetical protein [Streptomyces sp. NBC_00209]|uniref:hypothetical protein n=1 Tax=Streptomyces sp. NBC_00209 TaxID=2975682 RepID=UPI00324F0E71
MKRRRTTGHTTTQEIPPTPKTFALAATVVGLIGAFAVTPAASAAVPDEGGRIPS